MKWPRRDPAGGQQSAGVVPLEEAGVGRPGQELGVLAGSHEQVAVGGRRPWIDAERRARGQLRTASSRVGAQAMTLASIAS